MSNSLLTLNDDMMKNFYKGKKVLITGGLGFLGSNLAHQLVKFGAKVTLLDCLLKSHGGNPFNIHGIKKEVEWVKGDIRNFSLVQKLIKGKELLFNIAAQTSHTDSIVHPFLDVEINTKGQINILESAKAHNPFLKIVYCSTRAVYGVSKKKVLDEEILPNPMDIYSADKLAGENYHRIYAKVFGLDTIILRCANGYGPRAQMLQPSFGILNWFIRLALDNQEIKIFGDGKQVRDYVYVSDIAQAFLNAGKVKQGEGNIYNVGCGKGIPLIEIVKKIVQIAGSGKIVYVPWPETNKKIDVGDFTANIDKIKKEIGWRARVPLEEGLSQTIQFYKENKKYYW